MRITAGVFAAALLVGVSSVALAAGPETGTSGSGAGVMTKEQVVSELQNQGYSHVSIAPSVNDKMGGSGNTVSPQGGEAHSASPTTWAGTAERNGKEVRITVDSAGHVTEE
jgi:hypothetical protein